MLRPTAWQRTVLVTGFGAFPGAPCNPTERVVADLRRERARFGRLGLDLRCAVLPVCFAELQPRLEALTAAHRPDAILLLGVAGRRRCVSVETRAVNRANPLHPDAAGHSPAQVLVAGGPHELAATFPCGQILAALDAAGIDAELSRWAGDYVCNAALTARCCRSSRRPSASSTS